MNVKRANTVDEISNEEEEQSAYVGSLSPFETIQLTNENENLFTNLAIQNNEIESIEKQITEIQMLQEAFAEKIMDQEKDIDLINDAAIFSVKNIVDGNQQIREAIQNLASRRIIVLFCIIVLTFTLLFLDWYKP